MISFCVKVGWPSGRSLPCKTVENLPERNTANNLNLLRFVFLKAWHAQIHLVNFKCLCVFVFILSYEVRSRRGTGNKTANEKQKLRYKYKKEFKVSLYFCL